MGIQHIGHVSSDGLVELELNVISIVDGKDS